MTNILQGLNEKQAEAVQTTEGPLLIIAGAGSGKTRVLTNRIAYLIHTCNVAPWNILAVTFTNKAAGEMKQRVFELIGEDASAVWVATFHATCVRILRRFIDRIGRDTSFSIYDTDDSRTLMRDVCKRLNLDTKLYKERTLLHEISTAKNELISPEQFRSETLGDFRRQKTADAYLAYEAALLQNNALDFDDLIMKTVELLRTDPEVLNFYREKFRYIMVDEYQDTNTAQFELVRLLASGHRNLCVVGDDDQSIYKFRGANIRNILSFERHFEGAKVVKLEQNYRSTQTILDAANAVIRNNAGRKEKALWTENGAGDPLTCRQFETAQEEADYVVSDIKEAVDSGRALYRDHAILYRTNAQSRLFEERLVRAGVPYKLVGGVNFYARKEIKDILAYLKTIANGRDEVAVKRIINVPKRGIGNTTLAKVDAYAAEQGLPFFEALSEADQIPGLGKAAHRLKSFVNMIDVFRARINDIGSVENLIEAVLEETDYSAFLEEEGQEEAEERLMNIDELISKAAAFDEAAEDADAEDARPVLDRFLEEVALVADIDSLDPEEDYCVLMTLHGAKGLEFPCVYLTGLEDGIFPGIMSIMADNPTEELEEERRLCYVGITRAKRQLTLTAARMRMVRGETQYHGISRFLKEIPPELIKGEIKEARAPERTAFAAYQSAKKSFRAAPYQAAPARSFEGIAAETALDYGEGDRVSHAKFGEGTVRSVVSGGRDYEVTVEFDRFGVKKMFASFARLKKV